MTFIDQTSISIAVPQIQRELGLSTSGVQSIGAACLRRASRLKLLCQATRLTSW